MKERCIYRRDVRYGRIEVFGSVSHAATAAGVAEAEMAEAIRSGQELMGNVWSESPRYYAVKTAQGETILCGYSGVANEYVRLDSGPRIMRDRIVWVKEVTYCMLG